MKKAAATRLYILEKAFELIYKNGYQSTSIDDIIATTELTKGAFFYHFKTKDEMGSAIIDEIMWPMFEQKLLAPLRVEENPLKAIYNLMENMLMKNKFLKVEFGCPASNFSQEMTPWNDAFTASLNKLTSRWHDAVTQIIEKGKEKGQIRKEVKAEQVAFFVLSGYWGVRNFGKLHNSKKVYLLYLKELQNYLRRWDNFFLKKHTN